MHLFTFHFLLLLLIPNSASQTSNLSVPNSASQTPNLSVPNDAAALLTFKSEADKDNNLLYILHEPFDYCQWQGVKCQNSRIVRYSLPNHSLRGTFPPATLTRLSHLRVLNLPNNSLSNHLPDLSALTNLRSLILARNSFSGPFPAASLSSLLHLRVLDLSFNNFSGNVPQQVCDLAGLFSLRLQFNSFDGDLPPLNQSSLMIFNVSGNNISGEVPPTAALSRFDVSCFALNPLLCGRVIHVPCRSTSPLNQSVSTLSPSTPPTGPPQHRRRYVVYILLSFGGLFLLSSLFLILLTTLRRRENAPEDCTGTGNGLFPAKTSSSMAEHSAEVITVRLSSQSDELKEIVGNVGRREKSGNLVFCDGEARLYTLDHLMRASAEMLGRGTMGTTYKAKLDNQLIVTVKRLDAMKMSGVNGEMFEKHMGVVGGLKHPNLVPVRSYFQARDERLIIFDYQPNGSVFNLIHGSRSTRAKPLHWTSCLKIAEDVAQGLTYVHQASKLIHGNLKASNVLLGADFEACITDYCLATLASSSENEDPDSARYRGPEARQSGRRATHKSDVYAFGVLLLELVSGRPPSQHPFLAPPDMPDWVKAVRGVDDDSDDRQLGMLVEVASMCSLTSPEQRPTMWQVLKMIHRIKASVVSDDAVDTSLGYS